MVSADIAVEARGRYVQANGLDVYYEEAGAGPPLVVLHGGTATITRHPEFEASFRVSYPNTRGHGRTANPTGQMGYRLLADDAAAVIAVLGLDRPLVVGFSDGAAAALELGMRYPDLARALVLCGAPLESGTPYYLEGMRNSMGLVPRADGGPDLEALERTRPDLVEWWREVHVPLGPDHWQALVRQGWPMWTTSLNYTDADFARVTVPTLVVLGDRDEYIPIEDGVRLYRGIPGAELAVLPGQSHGGDERAWLLAHVVLDFLLRQVGGEGEQAARRAAPGADPGGAGRTSASTGRPLGHRCDPPVGWTSRRGRSKRVGQTVHDGVAERRSNARSSATDAAAIRLPPLARGGSPPFTSSGSGRRRKRNGCGSLPRR